MSAGTAVLAADGVAKTFEGGRVRALDGVGVRVLPGSLTVVAGGPGSGRTTLLRCLSGAYRPDAGSVRLTLDGQSLDLATADVRALAWVRRHHLAVADRPPAVPPRQPKSEA
uniref:ATP-binding cassette domain-containing protein n=1 Tax=Actinotalea sp. C106 TaxID=2908644 RepID=UPI00202946CD